jgi:hypothetical protein
MIDHLQSVLDRPPVPAQMGPDHEILFHRQVLKDAAPPR